MRLVRTLVIILACMLCGHTEPAAAQTPGPGAAASSSPSRGFDPLAPLFDVKEWVGVQSAFVKFGKEHSDTRVQLLKSIAPTGMDGTGSRLLYSVNLIVVENGQVLYSFAPLALPQFDARRMDPIFYMDDIGVEAGCPLELRDVTGDHVLEIIFHSGWMAASTHATAIHVLQYVGGPTQFRDIRSDRFSESWWSKFQWLDVDGRTVGIVADPVERSADPEIACHACPKFHRYLVYRWNQAKGSFIRSETIPSTGKLHAGDENPLETDRAYIVAMLKKP